MIKKNQKQIEKLRIVNYCKNCRKAYEDKDKCPVCDRKLKRTYKEDKNG